MRYEGALRYMALFLLDSRLEVLECPGEMDLVEYCPRSAQVTVISEEGWHTVWQILGYPIFCAFTLLLRSRGDYDQTKN